VSRRKLRSIPPRRVALFLTFILFAALLVLETGARLFWVVKGLGFFSCQRHIVRTYYPYLGKFRDGMRPADDRNPDTIEVLILGGSVVNPVLGPIPTMLLEGLTNDLNVRVNISNLADAAHTSRDSLLKYTDLEDKRFDLVLLYHGINELRANNCPPEMFRANYGHMSWYRRINAAAANDRTRLLALPITLRMAMIQLGELTKLIRVLPPDAGFNPEWSRYGRDVKSAASLRSNYEAIVDLAAARGERLVLMTYAYRQPADYTSEKFRARELGYGIHWFATEIWGDPAFIPAGLDAHNTVIRDLARELSGQVLFVDQQAAIPPDGELFFDICHLSTEGCRLFVDNLLPVVEPSLRELLDKRSAPPPHATTMEEIARGWELVRAQSESQNESPIR
jgi:hypothetical protein